MIQSGLGLMWGYLLDPIYYCFDPAKRPKLRMHEKPELATKYRGAELSIKPLQARIALSDNARQQ